jgi:hypothetical protein
VSDHVNIQVVRCHYRAEVGERLKTVFIYTIDPDHAVLSRHPASDVVQPVVIFAKLLCQPDYDNDVMDLVDLLTCVVMLIEPRLLIKASNPS